MISEESEVSENNVKTCYINEVILGFIFNRQDLNSRDNVSYGKEDKRICAGSGKGPI